MGATLGARLQGRLPRIFRGADHRVLMVAGAAAGVAAIFKAPATGAIFALEVPYQDDVG
jgi:CIC family chloride channel protein